MRLFVAVPVPPSVDDALDGAERELRAWARSERVRLAWVPAGARHVTLRFVGDRTDGDDVVDAVERAAHATAAPTLTLGDRVGLLGASAVVVPVAGAEAAAATVSRALRAPSARFEGHVTVARVRPRPVSPPPHVPVPTVAWVPESVDVIESRPGGAPRYRTLASLPWGG
ncbi:hypothetical protein QQX10_01045 [Demequina sp. SYSU T00039]|uniref:RNA 2',3'-cyclic phosphodiesterase n=1 Tax=Demequina lignilytica TaxID=3051663 RepID=A0AAW7M0N2_9MICO|nr:hypothetical protein [Demequina sp. SYSU T00039]MDN4486749.1 hypothetical protein [Demequina sp. SYSU T00039]